MFGLWCGEGANNCLYVPYRSKVEQPDDALQHNEWNDKFCNGNVHVRELAKITLGQYHTGWKQGKFIDNSSMGTQTITW